MAARPRKYGSELPYKVIDRPRHGGEYQRKGRPARDLESLPEKEGIRKPYQGGDRKEFSDHLGPLWGFLNTNCGKPWNKVYSKVCEMLPGNTVQGRHIRDHVTQAVFMGHDHEYSGLYNYRARFARWYVDKHGILRKNTKKSKYQYKPKPLNLIRLTDTTGYEKRNGIWHSYKLEVREGYIPALNPNRITWTVALYTRLSEKKLKELKLKNDK